MKWKKRKWWMGGVGCVKFKRSYERKKSGGVEGSKVWSKWRTERELGKN